MLKTLFDPQGRIGPDEFLRGALILVVIGALFGLLPLVVTSMWLSFVGVVLFYPWVVIWIKRLHDAGKSGWLFLLILAVWLAAVIGASLVITAQFAPPPATPPKDFATAMALGQAQAQAVAIPSAICGAIISLLVALVGNAMLKSDPGPNAYDPAPHMR